MILTPDLINGCFELFGGGINWLNVRQLKKDQKIRGVSKIPTVVFSAWGLWNLFYYPHLHQWLSFVGGLGIVCVNIAWVCYAWKYRNN